MKEETTNATLRKRPAQPEVRKPVLCAFPVDGQEGVYNVWRYDTPQTQNILFMHKATSKAKSISDALKKIES